MTRFMKKVFLPILIMLSLIVQQTVFFSPGSVAKSAEPDHQDLARRPLMGWSSYSMQVYSNNSNWINAAQIKAQSDAMHQKLQAHGYEYINIDAGWNGGTDEYGRPMPSKTLYPNGLSEVINYVHKNEQKIGLYMIPGLSPQVYDANLPIYGTACHAQDIAVKPLRQADYWGIGYKIDFSNPCAQGYINSIADQLGAWGIDFLKFDSVTPGSGHNDTTIDARDDVKAWSQALAPHHIWFELSWALDHNYVDTWKQYANGWRVDWDVECYCANKALTAWGNIARLFPDANIWWRDAGPGHWNDFDSLDIGNGAMDGLTKDERQTGMSLWSMSSAQLYTGNDLTNLDDYGVQLLTNDEVIAVNQAGRPAHPVSMASDKQVWYANNGDGSYTVGLFNLGSSAATVTVNWSDIGLSGSASVRDLWSHTNLGTFTDGYSSVNLPSHASRLFKVVSTGGISAVNDDDTGISYTGDWKRNGGKELAGATQNLTVTVKDSVSQNSTISPTAASFDKMTTKQADVITTMTLGGNTLSRIANGGTALTSGTDYTVSGSQLTIRKEYLSTLPVGTTNLTISFSAGSAQTLAITVSDTTPRNSLISPTLVSFDKSATAQADAATVLSLNGNELTGISNGQTALRAGIDYTVVYSKAILKKQYLATLPTGVTNLTFTFTWGAAQNLAVITSDTSKGAYITLNDDGIGIVYTGTWNRSSGRGLGDYKDDVHWTETNNDFFEYSFVGTGIELITEKDSSQGDIDIYVDNVFKQTISTYNASRQTQQTVYNITGLSNGNHTLKAVKKSGYFMLLDKLRVRVPDLFSPAEGAFDKATAKQADVTVTTVTYTTYGTNLTGITNAGATLASGTDYTVSGSQITIKKEYLQAQLLGTTNLAFSFSSGAVQTLAVSISDSSSPNSTINPTVASFDKMAAKQADVVSTMTMNGNTLNRIANGGANLVSGTDYTVSGTLVTVKKEYLAKQPVGTTILTFVFSSGAVQTLEIAIVDTTPPNSGINPTSVSFDINASKRADVETTLNLNGNTLIGISNGTSKLVQGTDYTSSDTQVTLKQEYLATLPTGVTNLTFTFSAGAPQSLAVIVSDTSRGRYVSVNNDDSGILYKGAWNRSSGRGLGDYMDDVQYTETNGDSFEYAFTGTGIEVITEKDASQGDIDIFVDDVFKQTVSTYYNGRLAQQTVYNITSLSDGRHILKVVKKSGAFMLLDKLTVRLADLIQPDAITFDKKSTAPADVAIQMAIDGNNLSSITNASIKLVEGTDYTVSGSQITLKKEYLASLPVGTTQLTFSFRGDYQNDVHYTGTNNDSFSYTFKGKGIEVITPKSPYQGDMDIYVDNKYKKTVSTYNATRLTQQTVFRISGLRNGKHTIKAVKKSGTYLLIDSLRFIIPSQVSDNDTEQEIVD
ncbi:X2-like carbohydrate binding domain-containing protein [Paenibacillus sp. GP183]|uniref:X2-like carbohydrate binding domain-containing protein n=1 Tax=Paenibacillus sp. GP183 TaxID=1882751 RepID=UPI000897D903|nr:X2-like carbohydrate binding domain-containing protein [Paenibacillus sp. GP183]SEC02006.1 Alpha galactosidase A [Paenibacillus sp. GP183]